METSKSRKGEATRQRILKTALTLFQKQGFEGTTLRSLAEKTGCSVGLTYRYFRSKDEIVVAFYQEMVADFETLVKALPADKMGARFRQVMTGKLESLAPYKEVLGALFPKMAAPGSSLSIFGPQAAKEREQVIQSFERLVQESTSPPSAGAAADLAKLLFLTHFLVLLFWFNDPSPDFRATRELLALLEKGLGWLGPLLFIPGSGTTLRNLVAVCEPLFQSPPRAKKGGRS